MTQAELKQGFIFQFSNQAFQESIGKDGWVEAEVSLRNEKTNTWANGFRIMFNGKLIHSCKTFKSLENRLNILKERWDLVQTDKFTL